jgi:hypothetical protein
MLMTCLRPARRTWLTPFRLGVMRRSERQQLCGLVVNEKPNLPRRELDALKALLWNAIHFGPESQNRSGHVDFRRHLEGRVSYVASVHVHWGRQNPAQISSSRAMASSFLANSHDCWRRPAKYLPVRPAIGGSVASHTGVSAACSGVSWPP